LVNYDQKTTNQLIPWEILRNKLNNTLCRADSFKQNHWTTNAAAEVSSEYFKGTNRNQKRFV